jgi:TatD DNase family protein
MSLIDTHCHLSDAAFDEDRADVIERARNAGVQRMVAVGGGGPIEESEKSAEIAALHDFIRSTAGIHPHDARAYDDEIEARIERLLARPEVVAVGETGLDYFYDNSPRPEQREALARHIALARKHDLPIVLHCRSAEEDMREVLDSEAPGELRGVVHCFTGELDDAKWYLDKGLTVSFTGIITFKKADDLRNVARSLPLDRLMVETDSPYLAPVPNRGKRNEPAFVGAVADMLATLHEVSREEVIEKTGKMAEALFFGG